MTIKQVRQALGDWAIQLRKDTPRHVLDQLDYLGHVAVLPGRTDPAQYGDNLLSAARYVGVYRGRDKRDDTMLTGAGMAFWLGDEDDKGDIFETAVTLTAQTLAQSVTALLPASGSITVGTLHSVAGTYTGRHQWETPRKAIDYVTGIFDAEWRVTNTGTLDAGTVAQLYVTTPKTLLVRQGLEGRELARLAIGGSMRLATDVEDYTTRVVVLAEGEAGSIATGDADALSVPYNDIHGNDVKITRLVSSAETTAANAPALAQLQLNRFANPRNAVTLDADAYDITGDLVVGDYLAVFDPDNGFYDLDNEAYWRGQPINPIYLRCQELTWPVPAGWTVAFRRADGSWLDLTDFYVPETGRTQIVVGEFNRALTAVGGQPVGTRPVVDTSVPAAPTFTGFSVGIYQSVETGGRQGTTRATIRAQWSTPLNVDGSTVLDGDHYEIRYRANATIGYTITHDEMEAFTHDDFGTHDAMLSSPVQTDPQWMLAVVAWGTNAFNITELTPGVEYQLQIRAVDSASPPNRGAWSASSFVTTLGDIIPPSRPAAPVVAASRIAIQVVHQLGKASGGTFNLEQDLHHLDVHVGGAASFFPDSSNKVGELIANAGNLAGEIPAVGSFQIEPIDQVHVKVVAVDGAGNRSTASDSATQTADLIDDAHISDLTVSKVTAGTIGATWVNAGLITTALTGRRVELSGAGLTAYGLNGGKTIELSGTDKRISFYEPVDSTESDIYVNPPVEIGNTSDDTWGMRIADLFGETKVLVGQLDPDGGTGSENYGLAAVDPSGNLVPLSRLAFGPSADDVSTRQSTASATYTDLATVGPTVSVEIGTLGRCIVIVSAFLELEVPSGSAINTGGGYMGFDVDGPTSSSAQDSKAANLSFRYDQVPGPEDTTYEANASICRMVMLEGLSAGTYTITAKYRRDTAGATFFQHRSLIALPY